MSALTRTRGTRGRALSFVAFVLPVAVAGCSGIGTRQRLTTASGPTTTVDTADLAGVTLPPGVTAANASPALAATHLRTLRGTTFTVRHSVTVGGKVSSVSVTRVGAAVAERTRKNTHPDGITTTHSWTNDTARYVRTTANGRTTYIANDQRFHRSFASGATSFRELLAVGNFRPDAVVRVDGRRLLRLRGVSTALVHDGRTLYSGATHAR